MEKPKYTLLLVHHEVSCPPEDPSRQKLAYLKLIKHKSLRKPHLRMSQLQLAWTSFENEKSPSDTETQTCLKGQKLGSSTSCSY